MGSVSWPLNPIFWRPPVAISEDVSPFEVLKFNLRRFSMPTKMLFLIFTPAIFKISEWILELSAGLLWPLWKFVFEMGSVSWPWNRPLLRPKELLFWNFLSASYGWYEKCWKYLRTKEKQTPPGPLGWPWRFFFLMSTGAMRHWHFLDPKSRLRILGPVKKFQMFLWRI